MGTRGLVAYRYKGKYYIRYNHWDSYPSGLGQDLVNRIPLDAKEFDKWLEESRELCKALKRGESDSDDDGHYTQSKHPPQNDLFLEWTYTIDLDNIAFIVDSGAFFKMNSLPHDGWAKYLALDGTGRRCLHPSTPSQYTFRHTQSDDFFLGDDQVPDSATAGTRALESIHPASWAEPFPSHRLRLMTMIANAAIGQAYRTLSNIEMYEPSSVTFQNVARSLLEAIVPNHQALLSEVAGDKFLASSTRVATSPWLWYRGSLILLASKIDVPARLLTYVHAIVGRVKKHGFKSCTALIWSIRHVAVVEISEESISHSDAIPLLAAYPHGLENALHLLWHYLPHPCKRFVEKAPISASNSGIANPPQIPEEILVKISGLVNSIEYPVLQYVSRDFFRIYWNNPRLGDYTILPDRDSNPVITDAIGVYNFHVRMNHSIDEESTSGTVHSLEVRYSWLLRERSHPRMFSNGKKWEESFEEDSEPTSVGCHEKLDHSLSFHSSDSSDGLLQLRYVKPGPLWGNLWDRPL